ncbi:MAG: hypothetical protein ACXWZI_05975 [Mycobacterium sp.]
MALLVLVGALMVVISKTWTSDCRGDRFSIDDLVAEDVLRRRRQQLLADELGANAQPAELEVDIKHRLAG